MPKITKAQADKRPLVYVVYQMQFNDPENSTPVYAYSSYEKAQAKARELNKEYGEGCVFDSNWDMLEYNDVCDPHYYDVMTLTLDEEDGGSNG